MPTLSDIKVDVATQLGATNGADSVPKRDRAINRARRKFYSERRWSFCFDSQSVSITSQEGTLPDTSGYSYNEKFDPACVYYYSGAVKYEFEKVAWSEVEGYPSDSYAYAINKATGKIKINRTDVATVTVDYYRQPDDAAISTADDANVELAPDIEPITMLSTAYWWLGSERNTANFDRFMDLYKEELSKAISIDIGNSPPKNIRSLPREMGYNRGYGGYVPKGYVGRRR